MHVVWWGLLLVVVTMMLLVAMAVVRGCSRDVATLVSAVAPIGTGGAAEVVVAFCGWGWCALVAASATVICGEG